MRGGGSATVCLVVWVALAAAQSKSTSSGVYTDEQAAAGETNYYERCARSHGDDQAGRERAPALAGSQFVEAWQGKTLRRLAERIEEMPPGETVPPAQGVAVLAFLLQAAEMPSGSTALPVDHAQLGEITFDRAKPEEKNR
jgi:hypothetical protein